MGKIQHMWYRKAALGPLTFRLDKDEEGGTDTLLAYLDNKPVGWINLGVNVESRDGVHKYTSLHIGMIKANEALQGQGIGTALYQELKRIIPIEYPQVDSVTGEVETEGAMKALHLVA